MSPTTAMAMRKKTLDSVTDLASLQDFDAVTKALRAGVDNDGNAMQGARWLWLKSLERRFVATSRDTGQPWEDGSRILMPTDDKYVTRFRGNYTMTALERDRLTTAVPLDGLGRENVDNVSLYMESLCGGQHPTYSVQGLHREMTHAMDEMLTLGWGLIHGEQETIYEEGAVREITDFDLPQVLQMLVVGPDLTEEERVGMRETAARSGRDMNPQLILEAFGEEVNPMNRAAFRKHRALIAAMVKNALRLDDGKMDEKALADVMEWLAAGRTTPSVAIRTRVLSRHAPRVESIHPENCFFPIYTKDPATAPRLTIMRTMWDHEIVARAQGPDGWYDEAVDRVLAIDPEATTPMTSSPTLGSNVYEFRRWRLTRQRGTLADADAPRFICTTYAWLDLDASPDDIVKCRMTSKSRPERVRWDWDLQTGETLRFDRLSSRRKSWPVATLRFDESSGPILNSRGIPDILHDLSENIDAFHRGRQNYLTLMTSITGVIRRQAQRSGDAGYRIRMGHLLELDNTDDLRFAGWPTSAPGFLEREEQYLNLWIESYLGEVSNMGSTQSGREEKTATEASYLQGRARMMLTSRLGHVLRDASKVMQLIWEIAQEHAPEEFWVLVTGQSPQKLRGIDVQGGFHISMAAAPEDVDPNVRVQEAMQRHAIVQELAEKNRRSLRYTYDPEESGLAVLAAHGLGEQREFVRRVSPEEQERRREALEQEQQEIRGMQQMGAMLDQNIPVQIDDPQQRAALEAWVEELKRFMPHRGQQRLATGLQAREDDIQQHMRTGDG